MSLTVGEVVQDKYRIVRLIGEGGMGAVYEGENVLISRRVAIKVLHGSAAVNPEIVKRFQREAQAAGRIGNDHILDVLDLGTLADGDLFMVMEYLDGENLADRIDRHVRLTPQQVYPLLRQMLEGLTAAHAAGIIHRDLKPENVFILKEKAGQRDYVKIIDFGISKFNVMDSGNMGMTATGAVMGTPYYMAPEVAKGVKGADPRSDIYAVGVILYKAVTGDEPFSAETFNELLFKIVLSDLVPARQLVPELDPAFDSIISKAMAKDPEHRFADCQALIQALDAWAQTGAAVSMPPPPPDDPRARAGLAVPPAAFAAAYGPGPSAASASGGFSQSDPGLAVPPGMGQQVPGSHTPGSWANQSSPGTAAVPKRSLAPLLAVAGVLALVVFAVGAIAVLKIVGSSSAEDDALDQAAAAAETDSTADNDTTDPVSAVPPDQPATASTETVLAEQPPTVEPEPDAGPTQAEQPSAATAAPRARPQPRPQPATGQPRPPRPGGGSPDFGY